MTDPFDTEKEAIDALRLFVETAAELNLADEQMVQYNVGSLRDIACALASIEERLRVAEAAHPDSMAGIAALIARAETAEQERDYANGALKVREQENAATWVQLEAAERERDEALHAEEVAEQYREKAEARVVELEKQMAEGSATP